MNFLEILSSEEYNLLNSLTTFREEFNYFKKLDYIYNEYFEIINKTKINPDNEEPILVSIYFFVHYHYYITFSCFLRQHLSEAMSSLRKAIDGALTAYYIIEEPKSVYKYLEEDELFKNIKNKIKTIRKSDKSKFNLASDLILYHEECSKFGSHADVASFIHRLEVEDAESDKTRKLNFNYFQIFKNENEFKFRYIIFLMGFLIILKIFKIFFEKKISGIVIPKLEKEFNVLEAVLKSQGKKYKMMI